MPKIRVLIVDDSVVVRRIVKNILSEDNAIEVVGVAANGKIALAKIPQINPDIIILDVEMPEINGLEVLKRIRETYIKLPVIMFSAITELGATVTLDALSLGANDYVTKPSNMKSKEVAKSYIKQQLIPKIKVFCKDINTTQKINFSSSIYPQKTVIKPIKNKAQKFNILAIGVSTGGPDALAKIIPQIPANFPIPIVIVQHMPPIFTKRLAQRLNSASQIEVKEAKDGDILQKQKAFIAPGDYHITLEKKGTIIKIMTNQNPPENSCRPAVDVLFRSVANIYQENTLGLILTGMGQDGLHGCQSIRELGGQVLVQDEESSVVWGMPGIVANAGLANQILSLDNIIQEVIKMVM